MKNGQKNINQKKVKQEKQQPLPRWRTGSYNPADLGGHIIHDNHRPSKSRNFLIYKTVDAAQGMNIHDAYSFMQALIIECDGHYQNPEIAELREITQKLDEAIAAMNQVSYRHKHEIRKSLVLQ